MATASITITPIITASLQETIARIEKLAADFPDRFGDAFERFIDGAELAAKLVSVDVDGGAAGGAGKLRVALKPSEALLEFLAAFARDVDLD